MSRIFDIFEPIMATVASFAKTAVADAEKAITDIKESTVGELTVQAADIVEKALATLKADADAFIAKYSAPAPSGDEKQGTNSN